MTTLEDICTCEFGPLLGDGRTDSNRCPVHDMTREELVEYAANGWREVAALEARVEELEKVPVITMGDACPACGACDYICRDCGAAALRGKEER